MINKVIGIFIASDFLLQAGWGLIGPIFALFITKQISGGTLEMVGFIASTYWITKSVIQPFVAHFFDTRKGEKDDFYFLVGGMYVANLVPLGYLLATQVWHIFLLECIRGFAMSCVIPSWSAIFTRHITKGWEAFSWSIESTGIGFAAGFGGALGGVLASAFGFPSVFVLVSAFGLASSTILLFAKDQILPKELIIPRLPIKEKEL